MLVLEIFYIQKNAVFLQEEGKWYIFTWIQIKQVQKPWLFYILSTNKNTYIRHFHSTAVVQILHFAHSHGEKQNRDVIFHCKFLHEQLLSWQTVLPTFITDKKNIFLVSVHSHSTLRLFTYHEWWFYSTYSYIWCRSL